MIQGFMPPDISQLKQMQTVGTEQPSQDQAAYAAILEKLRQNQESAKTMQEQKDKSALQGAGIQAGATLLTGLMANKAAEERAQKEAELAGNKMVAEEMGKGMQSAAVAQQDAFARLMGSMRSAMIK